MTHEVTREVADPLIPPGYTVTFHEIRGYDSGDKWFVCKGPGGWKKKCGERREAIFECVSHAKSMEPSAPDEFGDMPCYLCRGVADQSMDAESCTICGGKNELTVSEMAQTFDGRVRLAAIAGPMLKDGVWPKWMKQLDPQTRSSMETLARNPCKACGTWLLEPGWVGSAYCSRRCCIDDHKVSPHYAKVILKSYTEEHLREREAAMLAIGEPSK